MQCENKSKSDSQPAKSELKKCLFWAEKAVRCLISAQAPDMLAGTFQMY